MHFRGPSSSWLKCQYRSSFSACRTRNRKPFPIFKSILVNAGMATDWQTIALSAQTELLQSLPTQWRINTKAYADLTDVTSVPFQCDILTPKQIEITNLTVIQLAEGIRSRALRATEVLEAFAARAAIAHQLVSTSVMSRH
jgi:hypothetical protein